MILGFMQPYFLPYPGYFALIARSDVWLVFDDAQMIRHGWVDRNRILHPTEGWQYIKVPLKKHAREAKISECEVSEPDWGAKIIRQLGHYRKAPHYAAVITMLERAFQTAPTQLALLNTHVLSGVCAYIGLPFAPKLHSTLEYDRSLVNGPGEWALEAARALGASTYVNPPGGKDLFNHTRFREAGIELGFLHWPDRPYSQRRVGYEPSLSTLDMLFWLDSGDVRERLLNDPAYVVANEGESEPDSVEDR
jgi:hypothetical protein